MRRFTALLLSGLLAAGCATAPVPYTGAGPHPQIERGQPIPPLDTLASILAWPMKLLLWNRKFSNHYISPETEEAVVAYLAARDLPMMDDVKFRLNQYRPLQDLKRAATNGHVALPYRLLVGLPVTLIGDVLLPGRLFPWGDYYNPFTNTVHLYSDHKAIALHEAGHVHDFASRRLKGTYAVLRIVPFVDLYQEYKASSEAITYLKETGEIPSEQEAYKVLYPAYGTYVGGYILPIIGPAAGALVGHGVGRLRSNRRQRETEQADAPSEPRAPAPVDPELAPAPALP